MKKLVRYFLTYTLYIVLLFICYKYYLTKTYGYYGFIDNMNSKSLILSIIAILLVFIYVYKQKTNSYSKFIIYILVLINFVPSIVNFAFMPISYKYFVLICLYWGFLIFFINVLNRMYIKKDNNRIYTSSILNVYFFLIFEFIVILFIIVKYIGINLNFTSVYTLRKMFFSAKIPIVLSYLYAAFKVINPIFFIYLYNRKKKIWTFFALVIQILAFLCDGSKSTIFSILIAFFIAIYLKKKGNLDFLENKKSKYYILFGITMINLIGFLEFSIIKTSYIYNYFIRRLLFIPSLLNQYYYDFFSVNQVDLFRQSILGKFGFTSPYSIRIQNIIGKTYFNDETLLANNGLFSDAYMNLGNFGILIMPLLLSITLIFLDRCVKNINSLYLITVLISVSYIFMSSSFFTVILTHGYLILCFVLLMVIPKDVKLKDIK